MTLTGSGSGKREAGSGGLDTLPASLFPLPVILALSVAACGGSKPADTTPAPTAPLPTAGLAGLKVVVYPLTLVAAHDSLGWTAALSPRRGALDHADSLLAETLSGRAPEVQWVLPPALRRAARRAGPVVVDPDQMATPLLRGAKLTRLPDPLWAQLRSLTALAGERYALVPAGLIFVPAEGGAGGRAELTMVLADVRHGTIQWRTVAHAEGADPWEALQGALKALTPGLP